MRVGDEREPKVEEAEHEIGTEILHEIDEALEHLATESGGPTSGTTPLEPIDIGFEGTTVVEETSGVSESEIGGSLGSGFTPAGESEGSPTVILDGPPVAEATPTTPQGQASRSTIKDAKAAATDACKIAAACGADQKVKITDSTCWQENGFTCIVNCECGALPSV